MDLDPLDGKKEKKMHWKKNSSIYFSTKYVKFNKKHWEKALTSGIISKGNKAHLWLLFS